MDILSLPFDVRMVLIIMSCSPNRHGRLIIAHLIKNTITTEHDEIVFFLQLKFLDLRIMNDNIGISIQLSEFSFRITKSPSNTQPTRQNSQRPRQAQPLELILLRLIISLYLIPGSPIINLTTSLLYSLKLILISRLVIPRQRYNLLASIR